MATQDAKSRKMYGVISDQTKKLVDVSHSVKALARRARTRVSTMFDPKIVRVRETSRSLTHAYFEVME